MTTNPTQPKKTVWKQRFEAVWKMLEIIQGRYEKAQEDKAADDNATVLARKKTIVALLNRLEAFSRRHYTFFAQGFTEEQTGHPRIILERPQSLSDDYIFGTILEQVSNDLAVIQRASEQRMIGEQQGRGTTIDTFNLADRLAMSALKRVGHLLECDSTVLTYLLKSPNIRVIPYAPVAMIGIPMTCYGITETGVGRDLLAIPHELGHHLYWNGRKEENTQPTENFLRHQIRNSLRLNSTPQWLQKWLEEIFADVVSCWIGGPITALSFQDLQLQTRDDGFLVDNGVHPIAALRPYIYSETFRQLGMKKVAEQLEQRWWNKLQTLDVLAQACDPKQPFAFTPFHLPNSDKPERILDPLQDILDFGIINQCIEVLVSSQNSANDLPAAMWVGNQIDQHDFAIEKDVQNFYGHFEEWVKDGILQMDSPPDLCETPTTWCDIVKARGVAFDIDTLEGKQMPPEELITLLCQWDKDELPETAQPLLLKEWRPIFEFAGWTTEGPHGRN